MAKNLASKLRTGAMIGLAGLALGATAPKANAGLIYDSGAQSVTNVVAGGNLILDYQQIIEEIDTDGNGSLDSYKSTLNAYNHSDGGNVTNLSYFLMNVNADLAGRGASGLVDQYAQFHYESTGADTGRFILNSDGMALPPGADDNFYYTIPKDQVIGWENVNAQMGANAGAVSFGFQAPKAVPEPTTMGALLTGAAALLAGRRIKENVKRR